MISAAAGASTHGAELTVHTQVGWEAQDGVQGWTDTQGPLSGVTAPARL